MSVLANLTEQLVTGLDPVDVNHSTLQRFYFQGLVGLFVDRAGDPWPTSWWNWCLSQGYNHIEEICEIAVFPQTRVELHDYEHSQVDNYLHIDVWRPPVNNVKHVSAIYPSDFTTAGVPGWVTGASVVQFDDIPGNNVAFDFPASWIRVRQSGSIQIVPLAGGIDTAFLGVGSTYLPLLFGSLYSLPQLWRVEYTAGFFNAKIPFMICDAIFKSAAIEALAKVAETLRPPGVTNISLDIEGVKRDYTLDAGKARGDAALFSDITAKYHRDLYGDKDAKSKNHVGGLLQKIKDKYHGVDFYAM